MRFSSQVLGLVTNNFWLKVISIAFATVLFIIVRTEQVREFSVVGRVRIITAENVMVVGPQERAIEMQVRLPNSVFSVPPTEEEVVGVLDVSEQETGRIRVRLSRYNFPNLDKRYTVTFLDPWVELELDEVVTKKVSVRAVLQGLPSEGLSIDRVIVKPEEVEVVGARGALDSIESFSTSPVTIEGIEQTFSAIAKIALDENSGLQIESDSVNVQVFLGRDKKNRVIRGVPVRVKDSQRRSYTLQPQRIDVELRGEEEILKGLTTDSVSAFVEGKDVTETPTPHKVWLRIPAETSLVTVNPDKVSVHRQKKKK